MFRKGESGNPGGRPKGDGRIKEIAREHTEDALKTLVAVATKGKSESARVAAAVALLDRGWGKPAQPVEGSLTLQRADDLADDELANIARAGGNGASAPARGQAKPH